MLEHGGGLLKVASQYKVPLENWIDLSTGINPNPWPLPRIPTSLWARLPEENDELTDNAKHYYNCQHVLPVAGSQAAIQALPRLIPQGRIGMLQPAYAEHAHAWLQAGHEVITIHHPDINARLSNIDNLLLINPNNPDGQRFTIHELLGWHQSLQAHAGWLIVDEAFIDVSPQDSLAPHTYLSGLIVLRSLGKFFGLAGARVGFVLAQEDLLKHLSDLLGPWAVSGPSRFIANQALTDRQWQTKTQQQLIQQGQQLKALLTRYYLKPTGGCALFQWVQHHKAALLAEYFRQQAILLREFSEPASLRFGLPANDRQWQNLEQAMQNIPTSLLQ